MPAGRLAGWLAGRLEERGRGGGTPDDCGRRCCCWYACWLLIPKPLRVVVCACESMVTAWFGVALVARPLDPDDDYDGADAGTDYSLSRFVIAGDRRALPRARLHTVPIPKRGDERGRRALDKHTDWSAIARLSDHRATTTTTREPSSPSP